MISNNSVLLHSRHVVNKPPDPKLTEIGLNMGQYLDIGQKVLFGNPRQGFSKSQKLPLRRLGTFTVTKRITSTTYQIQDDNDPMNTKTMPRNHSVEYYLNQETLPPMIEEYVPMDRRHDNFYERFMEQRIHELKKPDQTVMEDSPISCWTSPCNSYYTSQETSQ